MKTIKMCIFPLLFALVLISCTDRDKAGMRWRKYQKGPLTTIKENGGYGTIETRYSRGISFNTAGTDIRKMPPHSYFSYDNNGLLLVIESDKNGKITYEYYEEDKRLPFDEKGRAFLIKAIKNIRRLDKKM